jgi:hypothetical protein
MVLAALVLQLVCGGMLLTPFRHAYSHTSGKF